jgi:hypothetical protein
MNWRNVGVVLLLISIVLAVLLTFRISPFRTNTVLSDDYEELPFGPWAYNITLEPLNKRSYEADVLLYPASIQLINCDFWVLNKTEYDTFSKLWDNFYSLVGEIPGYPDKQPFTNLIRGYAKGINITDTSRIKLSNFDHDGKYSLLFINFYDETQKIAFQVQETYQEPEHTIIEPNLPAISIVAVTSISGLVSVFILPKNKNKRAHKKSSRQS